MALPGDWALQNPDGTPGPCRGVVDSLDQAAKVGAEGPPRAGPPPLAIRDMRRGLTRAATLIGKFVATAFDPGLQPRVANLAQTKLLNPAAVVATVFERTSTSLGA